MPNVIKPKRSNVAAKVPTTADLASGEVGVNMADKKIYINNGGTITQVGAGSLSALSDVTLSGISTNETLLWDGTKFVNGSAGSASVMIWTGFDGGTASTTTFDLILDLGAA